MNLQQFQQNIAYDLEWSGFAGIKVPEFTYTRIEPDIDLTTTQQRVLFNFYRNLYQYFHNKLNKHLTKQDLLYLYDLLEPLNLNNITSLFEKKYADFKWRLPLFFENFNINDFTSNEILHDRRTLEQLKVDDTDPFLGASVYGLVFRRQHQGRRFHTAIKITSDPEEIKVASYLAYHYHLDSNFYNKYPNIHQIYSICKDHNREFYHIESEILKIPSFNFTITEKNRSTIYKNIPVVKQRTIEASSASSDYRALIQLMNLAESNRLKLIEKMFLTSQERLEFQKLLIDLKDSYQQLLSLGIDHRDFWIYYDEGLQKLIFHNIMKNFDDRYVLIDYGSSDLKLAKNIASLNLKIPSCKSNDTLITLNYI